MEELDILKKHWNNTENFPKFSKEKLVNIIQKKSSSTIKWILIISIIEFFFGLFLTIYTTINTSEPNFFIEQPIFEKIIDYSTIISYIVILFFIYRFYKMYRQVNILDNTKKLMQTIIDTRKITKQYIFFNIGLFFCLSISVGSFVIFNDTKNGIVPIYLFFEILVFFIIVICFCFILWFIYRLLYGWLIKRLEKNYRDLSSIDY